MSAEAVAKGDWLNMSPAERTQFVADAIERNHKAQYDSAVRWAQVSGDTTVRPTWNELSEEDRERIRKVNLEHAQQMQRFGEAIRTGTAIDFKWRE